MNWIQSLNKAINYMEDHLCEKMTCEEIAGHVFISSYHFQRAFSLLTGITVSEYIRNRRLSLAGQELTVSGNKIIDIAFKYGYETSESFTKAFNRFHGIAPSQAKLEGSHLKSFNRLLIKIKLEGGTMMDYSMVKKDAFKALVKMKTFTPANSQKGIPEFWSEYFNTGCGNQVCGMLGICEQEKTGNGEFRYGIGCFYDDHIPVPEGFEILTVPPYTWAVFECVGPMPDAIQNMWTRIYSEWLPQAEYQLLQDYDLEVYTEGNNQDKNYSSEIWIPVKKK